MDPIAPAVMTEADVTIDGVPLSLGQVMTVRVAVSSFLTDLAENGLGEDETGKQITRNYIERGREVEALLINGANRVGPLPIEDRIRLAAQIAPELVTLLREGSERLTCTTHHYTGEMPRFNERVDALLAPLAPLPPMPEIR